MAASRRTPRELDIHALAHDLDACSEAPQRVVQVYGLRIGCDWQLNDAAADSGKPEIRISIATPDTFTQTPAVPSFRPHDSSPLSYTPMPDDGAMVSWDGLFRFLISRDGSTILGHAQSELAPDALGAHLFGPVLSFALLRRGFESLHATALTINGDAVALLGDTSAGKSTLAAALLACGARLLTDDLLVVKYDAGVPMAQPGLRRLKLMPDAAARWPQNDAGAAFHPGSPKRVFRMHDESCTPGPAPLRACFVLKRDAVTAACQRLTSAAAMRQVAANAFNTLDARPARLRAHFEACALLSRHVPVFELSVADDLLRIHEAVQMVGATLANLPRSKRA